MLTILIHGDAKTGKTWACDTAPAPRLVLDVEGGNRFTPSRKVIWDPTWAPPPADGTWDTCVVYVRDFSTLTRTYQWLNSGQHPFRSVTIDSISEAQQRCIDAIAGTNQMQQQDWGDLLRQLSTLSRQFRDLTMHPTNPLEVVALTAMTRERDGKWQPAVQGALATALPFYFDVLGYLYIQSVSAPDGSMIKVRRMLLSPDPAFLAGDRTDRLPAYMDNPTIDGPGGMLELIYGPRKESA